MRATERVRREVTFVFSFMILTPTAYFSSPSLRPREKSLPILLVVSIWLLEHPFKFPSTTIDVFVVCQYYFGVIVVLVDLNVYVFSL